MFRSCLGSLLWRQYGWCERNRNRKWSISTYIRIYKLGGKKQKGVHFLFLRATLHYEKEAFCNLGGFIEGKVCIGDASHSPFLTKHKLQLTSMAFQSFSIAQKRHARGGSPSQLPREGVFSILFPFLPPTTISIQRTVKISHAEGKGERSSALFRILSPLWTVAKPRLLQRNEYRVIHERACFVRWPLLGWVLS